MGHIVSPWEANDILDKFRLSMQGKPSRKICSSLDNVRMTLTLIFFPKFRNHFCTRRGGKVCPISILSIIQSLKVMSLILTLQVHLTLQCVFSKTDSVFLRQDTQKCVFINTCPRACISQYTPMGLYWLIQALGHVLWNTHFWVSSLRKTESW